MPLITHKVRALVALVSLLALALATIHPVAAQSNQTAAITGFVTDTLGFPLAGANVFIPGTAIGAVTDTAGRYRIDKVAVGSTTLRARRIGYSVMTREGIEVTADGPNVVNFSMLMQTLIFNYLGPAPPAEPNKTSSRQGGGEHPGGKGAKASTLIVKVPLYQPRPVVFHLPRVGGNSQTRTATITGIVKDLSSGAPLAQVNVWVQGTSFGATTDRAGRYTIGYVPPGQVTLVATRVGYQRFLRPDFNVAVAHPNLADITLAVMPLTLSGVVSTGLIDPARGCKIVLPVTGDEYMDCDGVRRISSGAAGSPLEQLMGKMPALRVPVPLVPAKTPVLYLPSPVIQTLDRFCSDNSAHRFRFCRREPLTQRQLGTVTLIRELR